MAIRKLMVSKNILFMKIRIDYYLIIEETVCDGESAVSYGVEVQKVSTDEFGTKHKQSEKVNDITLNKYTAYDFIKLISENDVMPATLMDVVTDKIEEGFFEPKKEPKKINIVKQPKVLKA